MPEPAARSAALLKTESPMQVLALSAADGDAGAPYHGFPRGRGRVAVGHGSVSARRRGEGHEEKPAYQGAAQGAESGAEGEPRPNH